MLRSDVRGLITRGLSTEDEMRGVHTFLIPPARALASVLVLASTFACAGTASAQDAPPPVPPGYETPPQTVQPQTVQPGATQQVVVVPAYGGAAYGQAPAVMPTAPAQLVPARTRAVQVERSDSIRALWLPGLIALPVAWVSTWTAASTYFLGDALTYSWIPVIGPWLMLTQDLNGYEVPVVISGIVQGAATLMIVLGLSIRRTWTETQYVLEPPAVTFDVAPMPGGGYGSVTFRM